MIPILQKNFFRPGRPPVRSYSRACGVCQKKLTVKNNGTLRAQIDGFLAHKISTFDPWVRLGCLGYFLRAIFNFRMNGKGPES